MLIKADPVSDESEQEIIMKGAFGTDLELGWESKRYHMQMKDRQVRIAVDDDVTNTNVSPVIADIWPVNQWAHLVAVRNRDQDSLFMYLNGEKIDSKADGTELDISSPDLPLVIGNSQAHDSKYDGLLDDLRFYNYALSANAVKALFDESSIVVSISSDEEMIPVEYALKQNYPNPFNPETTIEFNLVKTGMTTLVVYNMLGKKLLTLVNNRLETGTHKVTFDASRFASGVCFYHLKSGEFSKVRKMILLK